jgi:hypothetical protein
VPTQRKCWRLARRAGKAWLIIGPLLAVLYRTHYGLLFARALLSVTAATPATSLLAVLALVRTADSYERCG